MNKKYVVTLSEEERQGLEVLVKQGKAAARKISRAWVLLKADAGAAARPGPMSGSAPAFGVGLATIYRVRQRFVEEGLEAVLARRTSRGIARATTRWRAEAHLIALACSKPPPGRRRWTIRLLAEKMVELEVVDHARSPTRPCGRRSKKTRAAKPA